MTESTSRPEGSTSGAGTPGDASADSGATARDGGKQPVPQNLGDLLLFVPRLAVLLGRLIADPQVAGADKMLLVAVVAYIWSPIDIIPDFIPVVGQIDDIYLVAMALLRLINRSGVEKIRQYWDGPEDIVGFLNTVTNLATRYLPEPARHALRGWIDARDTNPPPA